MKGVVIKVSRTLLRRLWHKHSASQLLEIVWEESMLLDDLVAGQQTPILAKDTFKKVNKGMNLWN